MQKNSGKILAINEEEQQLINNFSASLGWCELDKDVLMNVTLEIYAKHSVAGVNRLSGFVSNQSGTAIFRLYLLDRDFLYFWKHFLIKQLEWHHG